MSSKWWLVFAAFVCLVFMFAVPTFMVPVLYSLIIDEFGWSRTQVSLFATVKFMSGGIVGVMFGFLLDRLSMRKIVLGSGALTGLAMIGFLAINSLVSFYAVGLVLGIGAIGIIVSMKVLVSKAFRERQGLAVGLALLGTSAGGAMIRPLTPKLAQMLGWRASVAVMSVGIFAVALPLFLWLVRDEDELPSVSAVAPKQDGELAAVVGSRTFWMLALAVMCIGFADQALSQHFVLYLDKDVGLGLELAAAAGAIVSLISIAGKVGFGWVYDKLSTKGVALCYALMAVAALIAIPVEGGVLLGALVISRGLAHGGAIVDIPVMSKHCFGPKLLGRTIGILTAAVTLGFAAGPPVVGYLFDTQGTYRYAFILLAVLSVGAGLFVLAAKPTYWEEHIRTRGEPETAARTAETPV